MRLVTEAELAAVAAAFETRKGGLTGYRLELLDDPVSGWCLRNYLILTEAPDLLDAGLGEADLYWSRYYWLTRYDRVWAAVDPVRYDPAVQDQLTDMLEDDVPCDETWSLNEIIADAERDAGVQLRSGGSDIGEPRA